MANKVFVEFEVDDAGALKKITAFNSAIQKTGKGIEDSFGKVGTGFKRAGKEVGVVGSSVDIVTGKVTKFTTQTTKGLKQTNSALSTFTGTLGAIAVSRGIQIINQQIQESIQLAIAFDKALIGVEKTTGLTGKALADLGKDTLTLSKRIPKAASELLALQKIAGQLGVRGSRNLLQFAETMTRLEESTDVAGEAGAQNILKILNITEEGVSKIENFGSAISFLGNNFNAMESQIVESGSAIATATSRFDLSSADVIGLATATVELGLQTRVSGTTIGQTFREIDQSIRTGGESFKLLQKLTGESGDQIKKSFGEEPAKFFAKFIKGISKVDNISAVLEKFNLRGAQVERVLPSLAKKTDVLTAALEGSNREFTKNIALVEESDKAFQSLEAREELVDNRIAALTKSTGEGLSKALIGSKERVADLGESMSKTSSILAEMFDSDPAEKMAEVNFQIAESEKVLEVQRKGLEKIKEEGGPQGFAAIFIKGQEDFQKEIDRTTIRLEKLKQTQKDLASAAFVGPLPQEGADAEDSGKDDLGEIDKQLTEKQLLIINKRKELQAALVELEDQIVNENNIAREERTIADLEVSDEEKINALVALEEFEDKRLEIQRTAALARTQSIVDENQRALEQDKVNKQFVAKQDKINNTRKLKAQVAVQKKQRELDVANEKASLELAKAGADAILALTGDNALAALALGKAFAVADVFVKDGMARASASAAALSAAAGSGPNAPAVYTAALAGFNASITKNTALSLGIIATQTVAGIARMQTGGLVTGPQTGDRNIIRVDGGEGILTREGVRAIADLNQGNSPASAGGSSTTVVVENFIGQPEFVQELIQMMNDEQEFNGAKLEARGTVD